MNFYFLFHAEQKKGVFVRNLTKFNSLLFSKGKKIVLSLLTCDVCTGRKRPALGDLVDFVCVLEVGDRKLTAWSFEVKVDPAFEVMRWVTCVKLTRDFYFADSRNVDGFAPSTVSGVVGNQIGDSGVIKTYTNEGGADLAAKLENMIGEAGTGRSLEELSRMEEGKVAPEIIKQCLQHVLFVPPHDVS